jgi:hypothetical protein
MHGITRTRNLKNEDSEAIGDIYRITIRYADGRALRFSPDAGREYFSEDDILHLVEIVMKAAATSEWASINTRMGF